MNEAFVEINGVSTKIVTFGRWIEEGKRDTNELIILIPGNPGVNSFYKKFAKTLYERTNIPVWCLSHAGHNLSSKDMTKLPKFNENKSLYGLKGQIDHKIEFFKKYVPDDAKVHLIGHSIGSYMLLEIVEHPLVKPKLLHSFLLFPTIERMRETKNGKFLTTFVRPIVWLLVFLCWIYTLLPQFLCSLLVFVYMFIANVPKDLKGSINELLKPGVLKRVFFLAFEEMDMVRERNNGVIRSNVGIIRGMYGRTDGWAPEEYCVGLRRDIPEVQVELTDVNHTFVFNKSEEVAGRVAEWIRAG